VLLRYLRVVCGDLAEDVASETWLKAMTGLGSFRGSERAFRGWLTVIGRNHATDLARRAARRPETLLGNRDAGTVATSPDAAEVALERWGTEEALRLLTTLPPAQAEMVALRVIVGLEPAEIARMLDRTPGAVRVSVHRALTTLGRLLAARADAVTPVPSEAFSRRHV
jgi:RNA polymerase sigma-70 factor (ECF subfamily)